MIRHLLALSAATLSLHALAAAPASYTIVDLGADEQPLAVNNKGRIVGYTISTHLPVTFADGVWTPLAIRGSSGEARAVNSHGVIVGFDHQQVQWVDGQRIHLAKTQFGKAEGIANDGTVVGRSGGGGGGEVSCYRWKNGVINFLPAPGDFCDAHGIDPTGTFVAAESDDDAIIFDSAGAHDLGTLVQGGFSSAVAVNRHGHAAVLSTYDNSNQWAAVYWDGTHLVDIGLHPNGTQSVSTAINQADDVLVGGLDGVGHTLFLYSGPSKTITPIEPLISNPKGWAFDVDPALEVAALANDGTIYGAAHFKGAMHAFKLVPSAD